MQDERDAYACEQLRHRGFFETLEGASIGRREYPGLIFKLRNTPNALRRAAPALGQANEYVYREVMGYGDEEYRRAEQSGQIGLDYAPGVVPWLEHAD